MVGVVFLSVPFVNFIMFAAEVRPAPHMDNLVSIYKSMEIASGVNIFVTQNATSTKLSGILAVTHFSCKYAKDMHKFCGTYYRYHSSKYQLKTCTDFICMSSDLCSIIAYFIRFMFNLHCSV